MSPSNYTCPLCLSEGATLFYTSHQKNLERDYFHCPTCDLVFVPSKFHIDPDAARARYLTHDNDPDNADYRRFLSRLWDELRPRLPEGARGLDYGAGPGPALAAMIEEDGYSADLYDPLFHPDEHSPRPKPTTSSPAPRPSSTSPPPAPTSSAYTNYSPPAHTSPS